MTKVHIVIPVYNQWTLCHELLWKLQKIEGKNISSILLVDDCSTDPEVAGGMKWWASEYGSKFSIKVVKTEENRGFLRTSNYGLQHVSKSVDGGDILLTMSTDVRVSYPFIQQIKESLETNPKSLVGGVLYTHNTGWNTFGSRTLPYLEGWLLATTSRKWEDLGYFDERYSPCDYEDMDLSTTALANGYELVPLNNPGVVHLGGKSIGYSSEREARTKKNQKKFEEKWIK